MKDLEKIIRYLDGEMKGEEKHLFEQELVGDKSIKQSKLLMEEIDRAIDDDQVFAEVVLESLLDEPLGGL